jgi:ribosomal protein L7Ae-like RNA K-turn-binding protein
MTEIEKGALDVAKSLGIDHQYVLAKLKSLADYSEDDNIILQSAKELGKIIGTTGSIKKESGVVGIFQGFTTAELEKATERKEISNGKERLLKEVKED